MQKVYIAIFSFLILALVGVCSAANWQQVTTFKGSSSQTTDYFTIPTIEWRIKWSYTNTSEYGGAFGIYIYRKGGELCSAKSFSEASGITYIHEGANDYYLEFIALYVNYDIKIEYDSSAIPEFSTFAVIIAIVLASATIIAFRKRIQNQKR